MSVLRYLTKIFALLVFGVAALSCDKAAENEDHLSKDGLIGLWTYDSAFVYFDETCIDAIQESKESDYTIYGFYLYQSGYAMYFTPSFTFTEEGVSYSSFYGLYTIKQDQITWRFTDMRGSKQSLTLDYKNGFLFHSSEYLIVKGYKSTTGKEYGFDDEPHQLLLISRYRKTTTEE